jgi:hypothetical protein
VERLEERAVPATFLWNGSQNQNFNLWQNWTDVASNANKTHDVPGETDIAIIQSSLNDPVMHDVHKLAGLQVKGGTLTLDALLTDTGAFSQSGGSVSFDASKGLLLIAGNVNRTGGTFQSAGTVVLNGAAGQTVMDSSFASFPNLTITNTSAAGVTLLASSNVSAQSVILNAGSTLTLLQGASLVVSGNFTDSGNVILSQATPGGAAPVKVGGNLALASTTVCDFTVVAPANGNYYAFMEYGTLTDNLGATYTLHAAGGLNPALDKSAPDIGVLFRAAATYNWTGQFSNDWTNLWNWTDANDPSLHGVPGATDTVVILGGPYDLFVNASTTVGNLRVSGGNLLLSANLKDVGAFTQDGGAIGFQADGLLLTIQGDINRTGGVFLNTPGFFVGTIVISGQPSRHITDTSNQALPNVLIKNDNVTGIIISAGTHLAVANLTLSAQSTLVLQGDATLFVSGNFTDYGKLFLKVSAPNNVAPVIVGGTMTVSDTTRFDLTMGGSPAAADVYHFVQYGKLQGSVLGSNVIFRTNYPWSWFFSDTELDAIANAAVAS